MTPLSYYLWVAPHLLLTVAFAALLRRKLYREFPVFFAYVTFEIVQFAILFSMARIRSVTDNEYAVAYSFGLALSTALRFGIIYEICAHLFRNYAAVAQFGKPLFRWAAVGLLFSALALAVYTGGNDFHHLMMIVNLLDRTASILQCGLLVGLFMFSSSLGLSWRNHVFGIAFGLGVFASVQLVASAIRAQIGYVHSTYLDYLTMGTYHCCVLVWIFYLLAPARSTQYAVKKLPDHDMEAWNRELQRMLRQ